MEILAALINEDLELTDIQFVLHDLRGKEYRTCFTEDKEGYYWLVVYNGDHFPTTAELETHLNE